MPKPDDYMTGDYAEHFGSLVRLRPMFGPAPFVPPHTDSSGQKQGQCPHRRLPGYTRLCCMYCHQTGELTQRKINRASVGVMLGEIGAGLPEIRFKARHRNRKNFSQMAHRKNVGHLAETSRPRRECA